MSRQLSPDQERLRALAERQYASIRDPQVLTVTASFPSLEVRDTVLKTGMEKGAAISYDRLEDVVAELQRS